MIPSGLVCAVLVLAAYRLTRLIGWDDFPPVLRLRSWATGAALHVSGSSNARGGLTGEQPTATWTFRRPLLAHFLQCAFCQGAWTSGAVYAAWATLGPRSLYAFAPLALSGAVGLVAKNLDP